MIKSPCKHICILDERVCIGCKRTVEEIARWKKMSEEEKQQVLNRIEKQEEI
jgi:uncharacterized protein